MRLLWGLTMCACAVSAWANPAAPPQATGASPASSVFADRVRAYVTLQKDLDGSLSGPTATTDVEQITSRQRALAEKIVAARRAARQGDVFTPDVARHFREIIRAVFQGPDAANVRRTILEGDPVALTVLRVNAVYSEEIPLGTMPPSLLSRLPPLPAELAYRIIGRALVLKDVKTNVLVDLIPDAMPRVR